MDKVVLIAAFFIFIGLLIACFFEGGGDHRRTRRQKVAGVSKLVVAYLFYQAFLIVGSGIQPRLLVFAMVTWLFFLLAFGAGWKAHRTIAGGLPNDKGWLV